MKEKDYLVNRITTANGPQLVALLYEELISLLEEAMALIKKERKSEVNESLSKGRDLLAELLATLEGDSDITINLRSIYLYVNRLMTEAVNHNNLLKLDEGIKVLTPLYEGWRQLGEEEANTSIHKGTARVTGLTYGKTQLNDFVNNDENKWKKG